MLHEKEYIEAQWRKNAEEEARQLQLRADPLEGFNEVQRPVEGVPPVSPEDYCI